MIEAAPPLGSGPVREQSHRESPGCGDSSRVVFSELPGVIAHPPRLDRRRAAAWFGWTLAFAYSFAPFDFGGSPDYSGAGNFGWGEAWGLRALAGLALHALVFGGVGALDRLASNQTGCAHRVLRTAVVKGISFCLVIEIGQLFLPSRHARFADLGVNVGSLLAGHLLVRRVAANSRCSTAAQKLRLDSRAMRWSLLVVWCLFWCVLAILPARLGRLDTWDPGFPLLIGNERSRDRPWEGEIQYAAIYDRALRQDEVEEIWKQQPGLQDATAARLRLGMLVGYDFTREGRLKIAPDGALDDHGLSIHLPVTSQWGTGDPTALVLNRNDWLSTVAPAESLTTRISASGAFSVEVWCRPASVAPKWMRIIGASDDNWNRNFTLGQVGDSLYFRVRNAPNGRNGDKFALRAWGVLSQNRSHIVATYDEGVSQLFHNGRPLDGTVDLRAPSLLLGLGLGSTATLATAVLAALSFILVMSLFLEHSPARPSPGLILAIGCTSVIIPLAVNFPSPFRPGMSLYVWFGPVLLVSWVLLAYTSSARQLLFRGK